MILYVPFLPTGGITLGPVILINSKWRGDAGLIAHEETHQVRQSAMGIIRWWWRYLTDPAFRCAEEVIAYKVQITYGLPIADAALYLSSLYDLNISPSDATQLLKG